MHLFFVWNIRNTGLYIKVLTCPRKLSKITLNMKDNTTQKRQTWISDIKDILGTGPFLYYNDLTQNQRRIKFYSKVTNEQLEQLHTHIQKKRPEYSIQVTKIGSPKSSYLNDEVCIYYRPKVLIKRAKWKKNLSQERISLQQKVIEGTL